MNNMSKNWKSILVYILIPILLIGAVVFFANSQTSTDMKYSQIVSMFKNGEVSEFSLDLSSGNLVYKTFAKPKEEKAYSVPSVSYFLDDIRDDVKAYNEKHPNKPIVYDYKAGTSNTWILSMLPSLLMFVVLIALGIYAFKKMGGAMSNEANRTLGFGKIKTKTLVEDEKRKTTFKDVAGCDEEKAELEELVEFLKNPESFTELGARIPRGVLLVGPPGTGKTLLARAVAGEAGAPFLSISGSDFVEMYVGVGASRVRDLFEQAKKKAPAIVFIDEIDAVGRHRGAGTGGGNDEREQTLNQLLVEMDGFGTNSGIIVIAATNRPDVLDPALLRPGRFDRQITVNRPDAHGREDILKVHSRNKPLGPDVDLKEIAKDTIGFTGADLENLLNEASIVAAKENRTYIIQKDIEKAFIKVGLGVEKKSRVISDKEKRITAFHEAGHAILFHVLPDVDPVHMISIIPTGLGAAGYTMPLPEKDEMFLTKSHMLQDIMVSLGGRIAEEIVFNDITTGASNDIQKATKTARNMVTRYGMSEKLGVINYENDEDEVFIGRDLAHAKSHSELISGKIDTEVKDIVDDCYRKAKEIILEHMDVLNRCAELLLVKEKIGREEFEALFDSREICKQDNHVMEN